MMEHACITFDTFYCLLKEKFNNNQYSTTYYMYITEVLKIYISQYSALYKYAGLFLF